MDVIGNLIYVVFEVIEGYHRLKVDIWRTRVILYIFLFSFLLFYVNILYGIYYEIMKGNVFCFNVYLWLSILDCVKDFI